MTRAIITPSPWPTPEHYAPRPVAGAMWKIRPGKQVTLLQPYPEKTENGWTVWRSDDLANPILFDDDGAPMDVPLRGAARYVSGPTGHERPAVVIQREGWEPPPDYSGQWRRTLPGGVQLHATETMWRVARPGDVGRWNLISGPFSLLRAMQAAERAAEAAARAAGRV